MHLILPLAVLLYYLSGIHCFSVPTITRHPENTTALVDRRFELHCRATGIPRPKVIWERNRIRLPKKRSLYRVTRSGSLRFFDIKPSDTGWYRCKAQNERGLKYSRESYLTVHAPTVIVDCPYQKFAAYGTTVTLDCHMAGIPTPKIQWYKNGIPVTSTSYEEEQTHARAKLRLNVTEDAKYTCIGWNVVITGNKTETRDVRVYLRRPNTQPNNDLEKRGEECSLYQGTVCRKYLNDRVVYHNHSNKHEDIVKALLPQFSVSKRCREPAKKLLCHYAFPDCHGNLDIPAPLNICRESCQDVKDIFCYREWALLEERKQNGLYLKNRGHFRLPDCSGLPSRKNSKCTSVKFGHPDPSLVTGECYKENGRWYNGTVNVTRSGLVCQSWTSNYPHNHTRSPQIYIELENSANFCRNPGGEAEQPWCYTTNKTILWESCDVVKCKSTDLGSWQERENYPKPDYNVPIIIGSIVLAGGLLIVALIIWKCRQILQAPGGGRYDLTPQNDFVEVNVAKIPPNITYHRVAEVHKLDPTLEKLEYPRNDIIYMKDIGQGAFGRVFQAKAPGLVKSKPYTLVAVKMLKEDASEDLTEDFKREALLMAEFSHVNIVKLLGVCAMGKPMCLLFEYMTKGDLNEFLRLYSPEQLLVRRHSTGMVSSAAIDISNLDSVHLLSIAKQIAWGMVYLSDNGYVHRDLATRNCLVGENLTVKISDFGLARSMHDVAVYKGSEHDAIPIRWMPVEAILYNKFTVESDVWSFGVVLWEIFSFALQPYYGMTHEQVVEFVKEGNTLSRPENTPNEVHELMQNCWSYNPSNRPLFKTAYGTLSSLLDEAKRKNKLESSSCQNV